MRVVEIAGVRVCAVDERHPRRIEPFARQRRVGVRCYIAVVDRRDEAAEILVRDGKGFKDRVTMLRKADERTIEATWRRIGSLLDCFTPAECANYLKNSGYAST